MCDCLASGSVGMVSPVLQIHAEYSSKEVCHWPGSRVSISILQKPDTIRNQRCSSNVSILVLIDCFFQGYFVSKVLQILGCELRYQRESGYLVNDLCLALETRKNWSSGIGNGNHYRQGYQGC